MFDIQRLRELTAPISNQVMLCDDSEEMLILASHMVITGMNIFCSHMEDADVEQLMTDMVAAHFSRPSSHLNDFR